MNPTFVIVGDAAINLSEVHVVYFRGSADDLEAEMRFGDGSAVMASGQEATELRSLLQRTHDAYTLPTVIWTTPRPWWYRIFGGGS